MGSLTREQIAIIKGSLLGDGAMRCKTNALLEVNHCFEQKQYVDWKYEKLSSLVSTPPKQRKSNGERIAYRFTTRSLPELTGFYRQFYGIGKKKVPEDLKLDPLQLAVWFMDDGSKSRKTVYLNTQQFSLDCQKRLQVKLAGIGLKCSLNKDKIYYRLLLAAESVKRFKKMVQPYILPMFFYKLPD